MNHPVGFLAAVAIRTAIVLVALFAGFRVVGTRHVGEMSLHDILLVLLTANAVQNAMTSGSGHLAVAVVSAGTLLVLGWVAAAAFGYRRLVSAVSPTPRILVHDGRVIRENLRRTQVTHEQLMAAIRSQGLVRPSDVTIAVLEMNGAISIVPRRSRGGR